MKGAFLGVALCVLLASSSSAQTYYVATTGSDSSDGSFDHPFRTIPKGIAMATVPGTTVYVRGGTYAYSTTITISRSGDSSHVYKLFAYPGERAFLDFSSMPISSSNRGIRLSGRYWYIKGFDIWKAGDNGMNLSGSYNIVEFCSFSENNDTGLQLGGGASNNQIINCDSYYNADPGQGNADGFSPKLDVGTGNYFYGCRSFQNSDDGWDGYIRPRPVVVPTTTLENCWSFMNGYLKTGLPSVGNGNGFKMGGSDSANLNHNMILKKCLSFHNRVKGFDQNNDRGNMTLYNCTAFSNGTNYGMSGPIGTGSVMTLKNCVSAGTGSVSLLSTAVQATNSWMPPFVVTNDDFVSVDTTGMRGPRNPDGSLPYVPFMHLAPGSDLIDSGTDVGLPYNGSAPDLGCYETSNQYTIIATAGANGTIIPGGSVPVNVGANQAFTFTPATGYHVDSVIVDGVVQAIAGNYQFTNVTANHTIYVAFAINQYAIVASSGANGTISPSGSVPVNYGANQTFAFTPATGYHVDSVIVDGLGQAPAGSYQFTNVTTNHAIHVSFAINQYAITASSGANGTISPSGSVLVNFGANQSFVFTPAAGYHVDSVIVDGVIQATAGSYQFTNVITTHTIHVAFAINRYRLNVEILGNGTVSKYPDSTDYPFGLTVTLTASPGTGWFFAGWRGDTITTANPIEVMMNGTRNDTATFSSVAVINVPIVQGWNMISNPVTNPVPDDSARHLFPTLVSRVFEFNGGYVAEDTMQNGKGYWGVFPGAVLNTITGTLRMRDSVTVAGGWNMVGSISSPIDTSMIMSIPPGLRASNWFGWSGTGYAPAARLVPGQAYWVKANGTGMFVLVSTSATRPAPVHVKH